MAKSAAGSSGFDSLGRDLTAFDFRVEGKNCALGLGIALVAQHQSVAVDDAGRGRVEGGDTGKHGFQSLSRRFVEQDKIIHTARLGCRFDLMERRQLIFAGGHD
jgi:hypothetical protein